MRPGNALGPDTILPLDGTMAEATAGQGIRRRADEPDGLPPSRPGDEMRLTRLRAAPLLLSAVVIVLQLATMVHAAAEPRGTPAKKQSHRELREGMFALTRLGTTKVVMLG